MSYVEGVDYWVRLVEFPSRASAAVTVSNGDGTFTIYINTRFDERARAAGLRHELEHIDEDHPKTADDLDELIHSDHYVRHESCSEDGGPASRYQLFIAGVVMACAIALHNMPEGMVIGASYAGNQEAGPLGGAGMIMAVIIGLHNIPEGMAVSVPLITGGSKRLRAVVITALSGAPTIVGAVLGYCLGTLSPMWLSLSLSFAAGAMFYVVFGELLPEAILMWRSKLPAFSTVFGILVGLVLIYI